MLLGFGGGKRSAGSADTPLTIVQSVNVLQWCRADLGITLNGSDVAAWADQSGNGHDYTQGSASAQPVYSSNGGPNGTAMIEFDGVGETLPNTSLDLPAPGTTPTFIWMVMQQGSWTSNRYLCEAGGSNVMHIIQFSSTPNVRTNNVGTAIDNGALTIGSWFRTERYFSASASDYFKIGSTSNGSASLGNADPSIGYVLGSRSSAVAFGHLLIGEILFADGKPSAPELSALDAYIVSRYGAGLT